MCKHVQGIYIAAVWMEYNEYLTELLKGVMLMLLDRVRV